MGRCWVESVIYPHQGKEVNISINRLYLLNKLGINRYFANEQEYIDISFSAMLKTYSHELAHYLQFVKHDKSSCESDLELENDNYDEGLAKEYKEFTQEIYQLIKRDFSELERRWNSI